MSKKILFPLALICGGVGLLAYAGRNYQKTSPVRPENQYFGNVDEPDKTSAVLEGALDYVSTMPKYMSKYYVTGYPYDEYGVCTDVVANALKYTGYDLMERVSKDIEQHPFEYDIDVPDKNIDFRRVKNLMIYFGRYAETLTTDISQIGQWQGGDIVIFDNHIGIVSDRRNKDGVPFVIHHSGPYQKAYEEDILPVRDDILAHFRV